MYRSSLFSLVSLTSPWKTELAIIQELLVHEPDCRLVTLVGPRGSGKTWLATQAAMRVWDAFADGVHAIRLSHTPSADLLPAAIADALHLPVPAQGITAAHLLDGLCAKEMLLFMDGFEHLLPGTGLIEDLLHDAPGIKLLITSRARLNLRAEWVHQVIRVSAVVFREPKQMMHLASLGGQPAWSREFLDASCQVAGYQPHADGVQALDVRIPVREMSGSQADLAGITQVSM